PTAPYSPAGTARGPPAPRPAPGSRFARPAPHRHRTPRTGAAPRRQSPPPPTGHRAADRPARWPGSPWPPATTGPRLLPRTHPPSTPDLPPAPAPAPPRTPPPAPAGGPAAHHRQSRAETPGSYGWPGYTAH